VKSVDWNDLLVSGGTDEVRRQIEAGIAKNDRSQQQVEESWKRFEKRINDAVEDFDGLIAIADEIQSADIHPAHCDRLLKQIAKAGRVSVASLKKKRGDGGSGGFSADNLDWLDELNGRHAIVPVSGKVLVMNQEYDPALDRNLVTFSARQDFLLRYENQKTFVRGTLISIGLAWLEHPRRRQYDGIVFAPGKTVDGHFNLFQGFGVQPSESGSFALFEEMLTDIICGGNSELFCYVWGWLAHLFQKPAELPGTSLVLRGKQGTGKNTFVDAIGQLVGKSHYISLTSLQQVTGRFSGHLADALLIFANEAIWGGDKSAEGALKAMVTDSLSAIERKGKDIVAMRNYKRLIVASNEDWIIPRGMDDRRFIIIDVSDEHKEDHAYFKAIKKQLMRGGLEALMQALMDADISGFDPRKIPERVRQSGWELKIRSGGSVLQWWFSILDQGYLTKEGGGYGDEPFYLWPEKMEKSELHRLYLRWCEQHRLQHPEIDVVMAKKLREWGLASKRQRENGERINRYLFPSLDELRSVFSIICNIPLSYWDGDSE